MVNETKLLKEASKIVSGSNYSESIDDEVWGDSMPLNSETAKRTRLNLKKQLDHTSDSKLDSMMDSAMSDPSTWPDFTPSDSRLGDIDKHLSSIDKHLANIEALLRKHK